MVIFGGGCVDCADEARAFLRKSGAIAVTTTAGKGVIADSRSGNAQLDLARSTPRRRRWRRPIW